MREMHTENTISLDALCAQALNMLLSKEPFLFDSNRLEKALKTMEVRSWMQTWPSTAGPRGGIGGAMMTDYRTTTVRYDMYAFYFLKGDLSYVLDLSTPEGAECYAVGNMLSYDSAEPLCTSWGKPRR